MGKRFAVMGAVAFVTSLVLSGITQGAAAGLSPAVAGLILALVIASGIGFDVVGVATTTASEKPFHALASDRVAGATQAVRLLRRRDLVATVTNDVIGDILGTIGGAMGATLALQLSLWLAEHPWPLPGPRPERVLLSILVVACTAALTVGGKAGLKRVAIHRSHEIVFAVGRAMAALERWLGRPLLLERGRSARRKGRRALRRRQP